MTRKTTPRSRNTGTNVSSSSSEMLLPVPSSEIFWRTKYLGSSALLGHLPFLFWLIGEARPNRAVTLNVGDGVAHFALCQAIERMELPTFCQGFGAEIPTKTTDYNTLQYEEFSVLTPLDEVAAGALFEPESIDLLIVDAPVTEDTVESVLNNWLPRMSADGVVLLPDTQNLITSGSEAFAALRSECEHFRFEHHDGLAVLFRGKPASPRMVTLIEEGPAHFQAQRLFSRLGSQHVTEWRAKTLDDRVDTLEAQLQVSENETLKQEVSTLKAGLQEVDAHRATAEATLQAQTQRLTALQQEESALKNRLSGLEEAHAAALADLNKRHTVDLAALTVQLEALEEKAKASTVAPVHSGISKEDFLTLSHAAEAQADETIALRAALKKAEKELAATGAAVPKADTAQETKALEALRVKVEKEAAAAARKLARELKTVQKANEAKAERIKAQTAELNHRRNRIKIMAEERQSQLEIVETLTVERDNLLAQKSELMTEIEALRKQQEELVESTSWKVTAPVRKVANVVKKPR